MAQITNQSDSEWEEKCASGWVGVGGVGGIVTGSPSSTNRRAFGGAHTVFWALGRGDGGVVPKGLESNTIGNFILRIAQLWDEIRERFRVVIEEAGSSAEMNATDDTSPSTTKEYNQCMEKGLKIGALLGEITRDFVDSDEEDSEGTEVDFLNFVDYLRRQGKIGEPEELPLRRRTGSSERLDRAKMARGKLRSGDTERIVDPVPFPDLTPKPKKPAVIVAPAPPPAPTPLPAPPPSASGPRVITSITPIDLRYDNVVLGADHASRLKHLVQRFGQHLYRSKMAPSKADMHELWKSPNEYVTDFWKCLVHQEHYELANWYWMTLECSAGGADETAESYSAVRMAIEVAMYRYSPNPKKPWRFAQNQWAAFLRSHHTPVKVHELLSIMKMTTSFNTYMNGRAERSEVNRLVAIFQAILNFDHHMFALVFDNFQRGMTQKVGLAKEGDLFKVMTSMGCAYFEVKCDPSRKVDGDFISAAPGKQHASFWDEEGMDCWLALGDDVESWYEFWWDDMEKVEFEVLHHHSRRDAWMIRGGKAAHSGRFWIYPGSFRGWGMFKANPDSDVDSARIAVWIVDMFKSVHGVDKEIPWVVPVKGDYKIHDLLNKAVYGDQTGLLDAILPIIDHWHPVKGGLEKLSGQGKSTHIQPVRTLFPRSYLHLFRMLSSFVPLAPPWSFAVFPLVQDDGRRFDSRPREEPEDT